MLVQRELVREAIQVVQVLLVGPEDGLVFSPITVVAVRGEQRRRREHRPIVRRSVDAADAHVLVEALHRVVQGRQFLHHS